ncbi:MAG: hypothetical protein K2H75_03225 [Muribaculaceae bacterium]|nr:hypothetical protein [Muribaculaceae bacterium]
MMVLAIGNAGGNIVSTIRKETQHPRLLSAQYVFADCNETDLKNHLADDTLNLLLDSNSTCFPSVIFNEVTHLIIIAGFGGITGTKFTGLAAKAARKAGVLFINFVITTPFYFEGERRVDYAISAIKQFTDNNGIITFDNDDIFVKYPDENYFKSLSTIDRELMYLLEDMLSNIES